MDHLAIDTLAEKLALLELLQRHLLLAVFLAFQTGSAGESVELELGEGRILLVVFGIECNFLPDCGSRRAGLQQRLVCLLDFPLKLNQLLGFESC